MSNTTLGEFLGTNPDRQISFKRVNSGFVSMTTQPLKAILPTLPEGWLERPVRIVPNAKMPQWPMAYFDGDNGMKFEIILTDRIK